jgi:hypothetical protein
MPDESHNPTPTWKDKIKDAREQMRLHRLGRIEDLQKEAERTGDSTELEAYEAEHKKRIEERRQAKLAGRDLKKSIKERLPSVGARRWADNETAQAVRSGKSVPGVQRRTKSTYNLPLGGMVKLVNDTEVYSENYVVARVIPSGSFGILLDPPTNEWAMVLFGDTAYRIRCKKLRSMEAVE